MAQNYQIVEGIAGVWHFHLAVAGGSPAKGLCGATTMATCAPIDSWGFKPSHMRHSYCAECATKAGITPRTTP